MNWTVDTNNSSLSTKILFLFTPPHITQHIIKFPVTSPPPPKLILLHKPNIRCQPTFIYSEYCSKSCFSSFSGQSVCNNISLCIYQCRNWSLFLHQCELGINQQLKVLNQKSNESSFSFYDFGGLDWVRIVRENLVKPNDKLILLTGTNNVLHSFPSGFSILDISLFFSRSTSKVHGNNVYEWTARFFDIELIRRIWNLAVGNVFARECVPLPGVTM